MILLYIFLLGCAVTGMVTLGVIFALAAAGFGDPSERGDSAWNNRIAVAETAETQPNTEQPQDPDRDESTYPL